VLEFATPAQIRLRPAGVALVCAIGAVFALPRRRKLEAAGVAAVTEVSRPASAALVPAA
jgi:hypothetical protein